jgi:putative membrane protein
MNISQHLANERTFLAFLRTAISLASFGITINRFALYLAQQKVNLATPNALAALVGAENTGIAMVILGGLLMIFAAQRFFRVSDEIDKGVYVPKKAFAVAITAMVLLGSGAALAWLFSRTS